MFAARALAAVEAAIDVPKPVGVQDAVTNAALAGDWAEPGLEIPARQVAPRPTALQFGKMLGVAELAAAVVELAGQVEQQIE